MPCVPLPIAVAPPPAPAISPPDGITGPRSLSAVETLRISVTDRCNFRCVYCMPHDKLDWIPRGELLSFDEIADIVRVAVGLGIRDFKLTGGEPLVRHDLPRLVAMLRAVPGVRELSLTTNGTLLAKQAGDLRRAGLDRLTISLDSLDPQRFREITRGGELAPVLDGLNAANAAGFPHPKLNVVAMRGVNDDEFLRFAALTLETDRTVRFIEFMPLAESYYRAEYDARFIDETEIRAALAPLGALEPVGGRDAGHGPARLWRIRGAAGRIGFISAMSAPFCAGCNRLRLTATGQLRSCLFDGGEVELRPMLRHGASPDELRGAFERCVAFKPELHGAVGTRQMSQIGG